MPARAVAVRSAFVAAVVALAACGEDAPARSSLGARVADGVGFATVVDGDLYWVERVDLAASQVRVRLHRRRAGVAEVLDEVDVTGFAMASFVRADGDAVVWGGGEAFTQCAFWRWLRPGRPGVDVEAPRSADGYCQRVTPLHLEGDRAWIQVQAPDRLAVSFAAFDLTTGALAPWLPDATECGAAATVGGRGIVSCDDRGGRALRWFDVAAPTPASGVVAAAADLHGVAFDGATAAWLVDADGAAPELEMVDWPAGAPAPRGDRVRSVALPGAVAGLTATTDGWWTQQRLEFGAVGTAVYRVGRDGEVTTFELAPPVDALVGDGASLLAIVHPFGVGRPGALFEVVVP